MAITSCGRETTAMAAGGACDHWQGNMLRPEIDGRLVTAGSIPVRAYYSFQSFVIEHAETGESA